MRKHISKFAVGSLLLAVTPVVIALAFSDATGFLTVMDDRIVDSSKKAVMLRGFNVEFKDFKTVLGERDIKRIADTGANCIRLVLTYQDLESLPFRNDENNFLLLDRILEWCEKYGVYAILDMHLAPGIQNLHDFVVHREKSAAFWDNKTFQKRFYRLWGSLAQRYAHREIVAGYDLLNEGMPHTIKEYKRVLDTAAQTIRSHDKHHILIIQEAILPDNRKEIVLIHDKNTAYSIHFFYPPQFSFYMTTTGRPVTEYPGAMVIAGATIDVTRVRIDAGNGGWKQVVLKAIPPDRADIFKVSIKAQGNTRTIWFDDVTLAIDGQEVDLPAPLVKNNSFEIDYPGYNWTTHGSCVAVTAETARTGNSALSFSGCRSLSMAESSPIPARKGEYVLTAWYKTEGAPGDTYLSLSWHQKKILETVAKTPLHENMRYAAAFKKEHRVPIIVGEFTAHLNPSAASIVNYLRDLIGLMEAEGFHWSFWEYYSIYAGVGIFAGDNPQVVNQAAWDMLKEYIAPVTGLSHK